MLYMSVVQKNRWLLSKHNNKQLSSTRCPNLPQTVRRGFRCVWGAENPHISIFSTACQAFFFWSPWCFFAVRFWALHSTKLESNTLKHAHTLHRTNVPSDATLDRSLALSRVHLSQTHRWYHFSFHSPVYVGKGFFCSSKWIFTTDFPNRRELSAIWHCISVVKLGIIRVSLVISALLILSDGKHL